MKRTSQLPRILLGALALALVCCVVAITGCSGAGQTGSQDSQESQQGADDAAQDASSEALEARDAALDPDDPYASGIHHAVIEVEGYGTIEVALNANVAPLTVSNFCHLVEEGFYDGLTFHRVVPGFMIQGGDPAGDGTGGSDATIIGEFADNGIPNGLLHVRGTISMARSSDYDSASSQFFIMQETTSSLDGQYAAFGSVTSGMEVVDAICEDVPVADQQSGLVAAEDQPVITSITLVD